jgi:hypothetical protein
MKFALTLLAGVVVGATTSVLITHLLQEPKQTAIQADVVARADAFPALREQQRRVAALEDRIGELAVASGREPEAVPNGRSAPASAETHDYMLHVDEARAKSRTDHQKLIDGITGESPDPAWSAKAATSLARDFERLNFVAKKVDCRTTGCVATLEWPSRDEAQAGYRDVLHAGYELPCDRTIFLDEAKGHGPYQATVVIGCENVRANE